MRKIERRIMLIALLAGVLFWLGDAIGDWTLKFRHVPFLQVLIYDAPTHEFFIRPFVVLMFIGFGVTVCNFLRKIKETAGNYQELFENVNDGIFVRPFSINKVEASQKFIEVNTVACQMLGYTREELLRLSPLEIIDSSKEEVTNLLAKLGAAGNTSFETVLVRKDGSKMPAEINAHVFNLKGQPVCLATVRDITARKQSEEALKESGRQLQALTARLLEVQEAERGRISKELHDELGQGLMWQKIQISSIRDRLPKRQALLRKECDDLLNHLEETIENMRRLSQDLKPWGLAELGLSLAAKFLIEESCKLYGIPSCRFKIDDLEDLLSSEAQLNVYRIIQESMTNIGKHSRATEVSAEIAKNNGHIIVRIEDNGRGFNQKQFSAPEGVKKGIGLSAIKERARILGGQIDIQSREGSGTRITLKIPSNYRATETERN